MPPQLLDGNICSWENLSFREVEPGKILLVYDPQDCIRRPDAKPWKALRGVRILKE